MAVDRTSGRTSRRRAGFAIAVLLFLTGCTGYRFGASSDPQLNAYPANYRADILAAMHAYLNDPTGIRDAALSEPMLKTAGSRTRYIVCLRFNGKQDNGTYVGDRQIAAVFLAGRFDDFLDVAAAKEPCAGAAYAPFPELEKLPR